MDKFQISFIVILLNAVAGLAVYYFIFNIYEITFSVNPKNLFADYKSTVIIRTIPINAFGFRAPFRHSPAAFEIIEGKDLVDIIRDNRTAGVFILRAKDKAGKVVVQLKPDHALLPTLITINIYQQYASINNY